MSSMESSVPINTSIREFLAEIWSIDKEFNSSKPSRLRPLLFNNWRRDRRKKIFELMKKYAELVPAAAPIANTEVLEEANRQLIKATCVLEKESKNFFRHNFDKILTHSLYESHVRIKFVIRDDKTLTFSDDYKIWYKNLKIIADVPDKDPNWFSGRWHCDNTWIDEFELHVHSENDVAFLLKAQA